MTDMEPFFHHRGVLADHMAVELLGRTRFGPGSGMFLAAPRRTGKSEFLRRDLIPALQANKVETVFADLWRERLRDPAEVISDAIRAALRSTVLSPIRSAVSDGGMKTLGLVGSKFDVTSIGMPSNWTIADGLEHLARRTRRQVCLIVDEAQQTSKTDKGREAMFGLKAARDAMNQTGVGINKGHPKANLMLVFTGSNRNKLASLVIGREQAFYGASVSDFPLLGSDYAAAFCDYVNDGISESRKFKHRDMIQAFELLWRKPEFLSDAAKSAVVGGTGLLDAVANIRSAAWDNIAAMWRSLSPLERAVLATVASMGQDLAPFSSEAIVEYGRLIGRTPDQSQVQTALGVLLEKDKIWKSARGIYALEDQEFADWLVDVRPDFGNDTWQDVHIAEAGATPVETSMPVAAIVSAIMATGVSRAALARMGLVTTNTIDGWRRGRLPQSSKQAGRMRLLHQIIVGSNLSWDEFTRIMPNAEAELSMPLIETEGYPVRR